MKYFNSLRSGILSLLIMFFYVSCSSLCSNDIIFSKESPDKSYKIIHFVRNCGATTNLSAHISIIKTTESLAHDAGNVFIFDSNHCGTKYLSLIKPVWKSNDSIEIRYSKKARVFKKENSFKGINITYSER